MRRFSFTVPTAIVAGGLVAGILDLAAVVAFWSVRDVPPGPILRSIATSVLGPEANDMGHPAEALGLFLHFAVSFTFAATYVLVSARAPAMRGRPFLSGIGYGAIAYVIMTFVVVPLSRADFGFTWPPPLVNLAASVSIHLFLFGLPIALAASRISSVVEKETSQ